jgi:hypothetical protein
LLFAVPINGGTMPFMAYYMVKSEIREIQTKRSAKPTVPGCLPFAYFFFTMGTAKVQYP